MSDYVLASINPVPRVWTFYASLEAAEAAAPIINERERGKYAPETWAGYTAMRYDDYEAASLAHYLAGGLKRIEEDRWHEALNCLPPARWEHKDGVERFCMSEFTCGNVTEQYVRMGDKFFSGPVNFYDRATYYTAAHALECIAKGWA